MCSKWYFDATFVTRATEDSKIQIQYRNLLELVLIFETGKFHSKPFYYRLIRNWNRQGIDEN